jgi:hypothetical protein
MITAGVVNDSKKNISDLPIEPAVLDGLYLSAVRASRFEIFYRSTSRNKGYAEQG